jgi:hypothetical protein
MNIQTGAMRMQNFHHPSLRAAGLEPPFRKSNKRAAGPLPALDTIRGAQGFQVRLIDGLERTKIQADLAAAASPYHQPPTRFIPRGSGAPAKGPSRNKRAIWRMMIW